MTPTKEILTLLKDLPDSVGDHLKEYLLFLKHKASLMKLEEDRKEELILSSHSLKHVYKDDPDSD
ncbi:MAG TPA: hypothetical protein ENI73_02925 [Spirochaetes bacterium]|nr:hypothetical protein [Spirochaetota bacterium]